MNLLCIADLVIVWGLISGYVAVRASADDGMRTALLITLRGRGKIGVRMG